MTAQALAATALAMSVAWNTAADCLLKGDFAGFDVSMRIFKCLKGRGNE